MINWQFQRIHRNLRNDDFRENRVERDAYGRGEGGGGGGCSNISLEEIRLRRHVCGDSLVSVLFLCTCFFFPAN